MGLNPKKMGPFLNNLRLNLKITTPLCQFYSSMPIRKKMSSPLSRQCYQLDNRWEESRWRAVGATSWPPTWVGYRTSPIDSWTKSRNYDETVPPWMKNARRVLDTLLLLGEWSVMHIKHDDLKLLNIVFTPCKGWTTFTSNDIALGRGLRCSTNKHSIHSSFRDRSSSSSSWWSEMKSKRSFKEYGAYVGVYMRYLSTGSAWKRRSGKNSTLQWPTILTMSMKSG